MQSINSNPSSNSSILQRLHILSRPIIESRQSYIDMLVIDDASLQRGEHETVQNRQTNQQVELEGAGIFEFIE